MNVTGGSYMAAPCTNSEAVRRTLQWKQGISSFQLLQQRQISAPYAVSNGTMPNGRVISGNYVL